MADENPLAGLLDRAGNVFSLAGKLGRAFHEEHQWQRGQIDPAGWNRHAPEFDEFCAALLDLREPMQNPPDGFGPVAKPLLEAARIAKGIRDAMQRPDGRTWAAYLEFFPHLNSVCEDGWRAVKEVTKAPRLDDPFAFVDEPATPAFSLLDRFPATPAGHVAFLEFVRDEVHHAAEAKRGQLERGYSDSTIESMVRGIKWAESRARLAALSSLPEMVRANVGDILHRELTAGTVEQIDTLLTPAVWGVRDSLEQARLSDLASKMVVVATAGDLWKAYAEGKRPCFQSSGISLRPGGNTATITCTDDAAEAKRTALDRAQALVTAEGGEKAAAMEKLIARVQLQAGIDKADVINMPLVDFVAAAMRRDTVSKRQQPIDENVSERLPKTDDEIELLKPAIAELLRTIPETWAEFNHDALTAIQANALFLLTAAGLVERRGWIRATIANHPTCFELRFQATGEGGFVKAMESATAIQFESWADAWRTWCAGETGNRFPVHAEGILPQEWRLTGQGIVARGDLANNAQSATVFDFVLKRGFFGPGFWLRKQLNERALTDDEKRTIARHLAAGDDLARLPRPAVDGEGRLVELRKLDQPTAAKVVNLGNWPEGADNFAHAFGKMLGPMLEGLVAKANAGNGKQAEAASDFPTPTKPKRSTERGEGRAKLIAALTKHHKYADGGCLNLEPIGNNELARLAGVSESTASAFFNKQFEGHTKYRAICTDTMRLVTALKLLNQEFAPHHLYGSKPPDEDEREDDE